jgi:putative phosphoesterase
VRLLLIADTHVPQRALDLPAEVWDAVDAADVVVHAGDWVTLDLVDKLEARCDLMGVWGNNDHGVEFRKRLPEVSRREIEGVRLAVIHETGDKRHRDKYVDQRFGDTADLLVFGHSHVPWDSVSPGGLRMLNPGSCVDRRMQPHRTYMTLELRDGCVHDLFLHKVGA